MSFQIVWTAEALANLEAIRGYIGQFAPLAAQRFSARLVSTAENLATYPERGRPVGEAVREMTIINPYIIRYAVTSEAVVILRIRHGARQP